MQLRSRRILNSTSAAPAPFEELARLLHTNTTMVSDDKPITKKRKFEACVSDAEPVSKKRRVEEPTAPSLTPVYVLVFDVETTGLVYEKTPLDQYPYVTQISMIVYDVRNHRIERTYNQYIKLPPGVEIPEIVTKITGITREICDERGVSIIDALKTFYRECCAVRATIAHNIDFDRRVLMGEFYRNRAHPELGCGDWDKFHLFAGLLDKAAAVAAIKRRRISPKRVEKKKETVSLPINEMRRMYCTMKESQFLCMIRMKNGGIKYPKLIETFRYLFPNEPEPQNLHNSMIDTLICLRCFVMMKWREDVAKIETSGYAAAAATNIK